MVTSQAPYVFDKTLTIGNTGNTGNVSWKKAFAEQSPQSQLRYNIEAFVNQWPAEATDGTGPGPGDSSYDIWIPVGNDLDINSFQVDYLALNGPNQRFNGMIRVKVTSERGNSTYYEGDILGKAVN